METLSVLHLPSQDLHQSTQILIVVIQTLGNIMGKTNVLIGLNYIKNRDTRLFLYGVVGRWGRGK